MSLTGWIVLGVLGWYPTGLLLMGLCSVFDKPKYENWREDRQCSYEIAWLGPLIWLVMFCYGIYAFFKFIEEIGAPKALINLTDWIVAGFRKPPVAPSAETPDSNPA